MQTAVIFAHGREGRGSGSGVGVARIVGSWGPSRSIVFFPNKTFGALLFGTAYADTASETVTKQVPMKSRKSGFGYSTVRSWGGAHRAQPRGSFPPKYMSIGAWSRGSLRSQAAFGAPAAE